MVLSFLKNIHKNVLNFSKKPNSYFSNASFVLFCFIRNLSFLRQQSSKISQNSPDHVTNDSGSDQPESPIKKCRFFEEYSDDSSPLMFRLSRMTMKMCLQG